MNPTTRHGATGPAPHRHLVRTATVVLAVVLAVALWTIATQVLGVEVRSPEMGGEPPADITWVHVVVASLVASAAAWGLLATLERFTHRARTAWLITSAVVLVLSLGAPLTGEGITGENRAVLVLLHVAVGVVIMTGLLRPGSTGTESSPMTNGTDDEGGRR